MKSRQSFFLYPFIFLFLLLGYFHPITALSQDLGRHLLTGKIIWETHTVPATNLFSYTYPTFPFINHHWLFEVKIYLLHLVAGYQGLFLMMILLISGAFGLIFWRIHQNVSPLLLTFLSVIYIRILFERTDLRPELFSFFFMAIMVTILFTYRERFTRLLYLIIPIELLWTNTHIYFPIGVLLLVLFSLDIAVTYRKDLCNRRPLTLFGVTFASGLATLFNPNFLSGALYPLRVFQNYGYTIEENQTPFFLQSLGFHKPSFPYLELAIVILFISLLFTFKKTRIIDWLLAIVFTFVALSAVRNFPLFVFATFIPCVRSAQLLIRVISQNLSSSQRHIALLGSLTCFCLLIFFQIQSTLTTRTFGYGVKDTAKGALNFFQRENLTGPIFNNFDIGSYIEYRLYPKERVFIDGRPEAYPADFIQKTYIKMQEDPVLFATVSAQYNFQTIMFSHTDQTPWAERFIQNMSSDTSWLPVYLSPTMVILVKNNQTNKEVIEDYGQSFNSIPLSDIEDPLTDYMYLARFFSLIGNTKRYEDSLQKILSIDPHNCIALQNLLSLYQTHNNPATFGIASRYQSSCQ